MSMQLDLLAGIKYDEADTVQVERRQMQQQLLEIDDLHVILFHQSSDRHKTDCKHQASNHLQQQCASEGSLSRDPFQSDRRQVIL